eukprot:g3662.t1
MSPPAGAQLPSDEPHLPPGGSYPEDAPGEPYLSAAQVAQKAKRHAEFNVEVEKLRPTFFATVPKEDHVYLEKWLANPGRMWRFANGHPTPKAAAEAMRGAIAKLHRTFRANCPFVHYRMRDDDGSIPVVYRIKFCICNLDALEDWWDTVDTPKPYHQQGRWMCFFDCNTTKPSAVQIDVADDLFAADERMSFAAFAVEMGRVANLLYPERMHKAVIIDAGYLATAAYYIVSRFLTQKTRNNVCFVMRGSGNSYFHHAGASGKTTSGSVALGQALAEKRRRKRNNHIDDALDEVVGEQDRLRQLIEGRKLAPWESTFRAFSGTKELEVEYGGDNAFVFNPHVPPHGAHPFIFAAFRRRKKELAFFPDLAACGDEDGNVDVARLRRGVSAFHQQRGEGAQRGASAQERGGLHNAAAVAAALFRLVDVSSLEQEEQAFAQRLDELRRQRPAVLPVGMHCLLQGSEEGGSEAESSEDGVGGGGNGNPGTGGAINEVGNAGNGFGVGGGGGTTTNGETATRMEIDAGGVTTTQQDAAEGAQPRS